MFRNTVIGIVFAILILLLGGCREIAGNAIDNALEPEITCEDDLCLPIIRENEAKISEEMKLYTFDLLPTGPANGDPIGHKENLEKLIERLNDCPCIVAKEVCYACIETYPAQSEIEVEVTVRETTVTKIMDILTSEEKALEYLRSHD